MRKYHELTLLKKGASPRRMLFIDTETYAEHVSSTVDHHHLLYMASCYVRKYAACQYSKGKWCEFTNIDDFWDYIESLLSDKTPLYIYAHNGGFDLPVLHAFPELQKRGFSIQSSVISSPPLIVTWRRGTQKIIFLDTLNFYAQSLKSLAVTFGLQKGDPGEFGIDTPQLRAYCKQDVTIIKEAMLSWYTTLYTEDMGPPKQTLASQAFSTYRYKYMDYKIVIDDDPIALDIARASYIGARVECFRLGEINEPLVYLDYNSMYPSVMKRHDYPTELVGTYKGIDERTILEYVDRYAIVCRCIMNTQNPHYPYRSPKALLFPTGRFETVLTTPEVIRGIRQGDIERITHTVLYVKHPIFKRYVETFYAKRKEYIDKGDVIMSNHYKRMLNLLYGKFGQRGIKSVPFDTTESPAVKTWDEWDMDTQTLLTYRQYGGRIEKVVREGESYHSHPAIAAHVTAYGRTMLQDAITQAGSEHVIYCDTDSLLVTQTGYERLQSHIDSSRLGALKIEGRYDSARIHGPKDYVLGSYTKRKGIRDTAIEINENTFEQIKFTGLLGLLREGQLTSPIVSTITKTLHRIYHKGTVNDAGFVTPIHLE